MKSYWFDFEASVRINAEDEEAAKRVWEEFLYRSSIPLQYVEVQNIEEIKKSS